MSGQQFLDFIPVQRRRKFFFAADEDRWYEMHARFYLAELTEQADSSGEYVLQWINSRTQQHRFFHACHAWACHRAFDSHERWRI